MNDPIRRSVQVEAKFNRIQDLFALLQDVVLDQQMLLRVSLAVEELFANTIKHAYGDESDRPVWLEVGRRGNRLCVTYADAGPGFNPFADLDRLEPADSREIEKRRVGGLGRILVHHMAQRCDYRRDGERNIVTLEYQLPPQN